MATEYGQWLPGVFALVAAPFAALVTWQLTRSKRVADVESAYASAANMSVETMLHVLTELRNEVNVLTKENAKLQADTRALHAEVQMLRSLLARMSGDPSRGRRAGDRGLAAKDEGDGK